MILQALVEHYEALAANGKAARQGWDLVKISYALELNDAGEIIRFFSVMEEGTRGKKTVLLPKEMILPSPVKRTVGIAPNFLWDNSSYILGADLKQKPERAKKCFEACKQHHISILEHTEVPAAKALVRFFEHWVPEETENHPVLKESLTELLGGANLVFYYDGAFIHDDSAIQQAWQRHNGGCDEQSNQICLVTGQKTAAARLHPSIKGVQGAQSSGASLVSFNAPAFCSYGKEQGQNAPTGEYAAFAYGTALNHLIADRKHTSYIGDTLVLFWAKTAEDAYQDAFGGCFFGFDTPYTEKDLQDMLSALCRGEPVVYEETSLDPGMEFYILGIAPNAARLSVRFFLRNSFGKILKNINAHYSRMEIERPAFDKNEVLSVWRMLNETVNQNSRNKTPSPVMAGEVMRAILNDSRYPATLLNGVTLRIRAEHEISRGRAAIIKAYYLKNRNPQVPEEVLTVSLNPKSTNTPYVLGRLFSVLEDIQTKANPGINATIKDKYFNSASATPATVFPTLVNLAQKHLRKLDGGIKVYSDKQLGEIMNLLQEEYPPRLTLPQQGAFQLGYYHQTRVRYQGKKEEK
jgi:CRISPR-associated protein Csd1